MIYIYRLIAYKYLIFILPPPYDCDDVIRTFNGLSTTPFDPYLNKYNISFYNIMSILSRLTYSFLFLLQKDIIIIYQRYF